MPTAHPLAASAGGKRETHKDYLYGLDDVIIVEEVPIIVSVAPNGVYCTTVATTIQAPTTPSATSAAPGANNSFFQQQSATGQNVELGMTFLELFIRP